MADLNKVILVGRLTRDPELRYLPSNTPVTDLSVAVNRTFTTKDGERREETAFVDVNVLGRQAENCCQYLRKGRPVLVEGYLRLDSWEDKNTGEKRSKLKVVADRVQFLDGRRDEGSGGEEEESGGSRSRSAPGNRPGASAAGSAPRAAAGGGGEEGPKEDIPF